VLVYLATGLLPECAGEKASKIGQELAKIWTQILQLTFYIHLLFTSLQR